MKVIIAGGRNFKSTEHSLKFLDDFLIEHPTFSEVVCGMAQGADTFGQMWAISLNIKVKKFPADWSNFGPAAGPIRNRDMAIYADALIAFPGGRGTENMIKHAKNHGLLIYEYK